MSLYQCAVCGDHTGAQFKPADSGMAPLECPACGAEELMSVDEKCRHGRTVFETPEDNPCWKEWQNGNVVPERASEHVPEGQFRLCDEHYELHTVGSPELPSEAIGRCGEGGCNIAVFEERYIAEQGGGEHLVCAACHE